MNELKAWRGTHGDVMPVEVPLRGAVNDNNRFRAGYYATEIEAWSGILASWTEDVAVADGELTRAYQDYRNAQNELTAVQQRQGMAGRNYEAWRKGQTRESSAALAAAVG